MRSIRLALGMALTIAAAASMAHADGDAPQRPATKAEKAFYNKVLGTIAKALPAAPANWTVKEKPSTTPPKGVPEGSENGGSLQARYKGQWAAQSSKDNQELPGASSAGEMQKAMEEMMTAMQEQDTAGYKKAQAKIQALQQGQMDAYSQQRKPKKNAPVKDACLQVDVRVNERAVGLKKAKAIEVEGPSMAFLVNDADPYKKDCPYGKAVGVLGAWKDPDVGGEYTYLRSNWPEGLPHTAAKNIIVEVRASEQRASEYLRSVDWEALKSLLVQ